MDTVRLVLFAALGVALVGFLVRSSVRGARSKAALETPLCRVALEPGRAAEVRWPVELGGTYELWGDLEVTSGATAWTMSLALAVDHDGASVLDARYALKDDGDGGVSGLPGDGVVSLASTYVSDASQTRLTTRRLLARFDVTAGAAREARCRITFTPGEGTVARALTLLVARLA